MAKGYLLLGEGSSPESSYNVLVTGQGNQGDRRGASLF